MEMMSLAFFGFFKLHKSFSLFIFCLLVGWWLRDSKVKKCKSGMGGRGPRESIWAEGIAWLETQKYDRRRSIQVVIWNESG